MLQRLSSSSVLKADPAHIAGDKATSVDALRKIAAAKAPFHLSRGRITPARMNQSLRLWKAQARPVDVADRQQLGIARSVRAWSRPLNMASSSNALSA